jgi:hypothetical protein
MIRATLLFSFAVSFLLAVSCTIQVAGNGSEITNGIVASAAGPADSALVVAYPKDFNPATGDSVSLRRTFTDKNGRFSLRLGNNAFDLLVYDRTKTLGAFVPVSRDTVMDTLRIHELGSLSGVLQDSVLHFGYLIVRGSPFCAAMIPDSAFSIPAMPPFTYELLAFTPPSFGCPPGHTCAAHPAPDSTIAFVNIMVNSNSSIILAP